ncbi:DUF418 domain-containing protein [Nocardia sp. XZ_19_385]|uniref:DUF418 domain-containing protein n=1 Tax=Nocardia sp. XZ_19_385 TaxID=2769488 RepID=UPI00188E5017|nr:DUF418 domain-containing protein [Nocardia sp. XZ_19_385]
MSGTIESSAPATRSGRRIAEIDILRGFALFGILVTNVIVATTLFSFNGTREHLQRQYDGPADHFVHAVIAALFEGRFYLLFAFLFGYSFTLQIAAAQRAGVSEKARLLRRCAALMAIGLAHVYLLWIGDILTLYAFLCLILIALRKLRPRTAVITGVVLYVTWTALMFLPGGDGSDMYTALAMFIDLPGLHADYVGSPADTFDVQTSLFPGFLLVIWLGQGVTSLAMFLFGMAAGKRGLFEDPQTVRRWTPRVLVAGFGLGLPVSAVTFAGAMNWFEPPSWWGGLQMLVAPLMTFAYIAAVLVAARSLRTARFAAWLAPAGRMAASNYIVQSVVVMVLYTGYGFALADKVPPAGVVGLALLTFAAQLVLSSWWLRHHPYGPVEWALRAATYLSLPPWRKVR